MQEVRVIIEDRNEQYARFREQIANLISENATYKKISHEQDQVVAKLQVENKELQKFNILTSERLENTNTLKNDYERQLDKALRHLENNTERLKETKELLRYQQSKNRKLENRLSQANKDFESLRHLNKSLE